MVGNHCSCRWLCCHNWQRSLTPRGSAEPPQLVENGGWSLPLSFVAESRVHTFICVVRHDAQAGHQVATWLCAVDVCLRMASARCAGRCCTMTSGGVGKGRNQK